MHHWSVKAQSARPHVTGPDHSDFTLSDYGLVSAQHGGRGRRGSGRSASKALLSTFESDAYPTELTGAVSVNFLFIERASSQLGGKVTGYLMHQ